MQGHACVVNGAASIGCLEPLFGSLIGVAATFAGFLFFVMILVGGFRYLFAGGDPKKVEGARGTLTAAFLGLVLVVGSYIIIRLLEAFTGLNLSIFEIQVF